jgi:hypothetical protein
MCSAYRNTDGKWVVVAINYSEDIKPVNFTVQGEKDIIWTPYRTSDRSAENLLPLEPCTDDILLAPRSVTTFVQK